MEFFTCPLCHRFLPSHKIERHVDDHFTDEELSRDLLLAQEVDSRRGASSSSSTYGGGIDIDSKFASLISLQTKEILYQVKGENGLMTCLKDCLTFESEKDATSILSGYIDHFQCRESEDVGWGCGWRNIQMLSSHLIKQRQEAREVLFGGAGFVPDIPSLQRWLEIAWELGFDTQGSNDFNNKIYGKRNWIGTTECAALLRSFGLRAMVVDFCGEETNTGGSANKMLVNKNVSKRKLAQIHGPMDRFLFKEDQKESFKHLSSDAGKKVKGPEVIIEWVWNYFSNNNSTKLGSKRVILSEKAPLYFQEDGHSRTIVGIQAVLKSNKMHQYNLLILDPGHQTEALEKSMKQNFGWQKLIKRGIHTLKKHQYQLCFIEPGIARGEEIERLKILRGIHHEI
ncbi:OLC1v1020990C2 [Oldenlandia corymbosa var. corymbosa]|uniref:OLC1v1020990C2 n=2 Tax=Oldenlandia corymbosa var. corymbosa TaxID=529605 RepID=A0AAV1BUP1_OLDCO|nr:OLC1v1020990C2 [Oldenlandia corymbosa var. corymbosa]